MHSTLELLRNPPSRRGLRVRILRWRGFDMGQAGENYVRLVGGDLVSSVITDTPSMRIEVLRRETVGRMHWHFRQPELSLFWFGKGAARLRAKIDGRPIERPFSAKSNLAIFPAAIEIEGEWNVGPTLDYTVVFLNPSFVGERLQKAITNSTIGFEPRWIDPRSSRNFCREAASPDNVFQPHGGGMSIQALAHISRISERSQQPPAGVRGGAAGTKPSASRRVCAGESGATDQPCRTLRHRRMSKRHFLRAFQESIGATPYNYVLSLRIEEAKRRLAKTDDSIVDVALATGFSHAQHFSTSFKKATGPDASAFRQRCLS